MKVVALERGHDGKQLREAGEVFDIEPDPRATWYVPAEGKAPKGARAKQAPAEDKGDDIA